MWYAGKMRVRKAQSFGNGRTVQDGEQHDIKNIVQRAMRAGGLLTNVSVRIPVFADIADAPSYVDALNVVANAQQQFESLPSKIRDRFANSPEKLLDFLRDPANREEAIKLGLVNKEAPPPEPEKPIPVIMVNPETPPKSS